MINYYKDVFKKGYNILQPLTDVSGENRSFLLLIVKPNIYPR